MARLFADENFPRRTVEELRRLGHDVVTIQELGKASQQVSDDVVLELAITDHRAALTFDRDDFRRLHRRRPDHAGIVACTYDPDHAGLAVRVHCAIQQQPDLNRRLILVYRPHR